MTVSGSHPAIASHVIKTIVECMDSQRFGSEEFLRAMRIDRGRLSDLNGFMSLRDYVAALERSATLIREPRLGLKLAAAIGPEALGAMGFAFLNAQSLACALDGLQRYIKTIQDCTRQEVIRSDNQVQLTYRIEDDRIAPRRQDAEFSIGLIHQIMRTYGGQKYKPFNVHFEHEPGGALKSYDEYFGCPVYFGQGCNLIALRTETLQVFSPGVNGALHRLLNAQLEQSLRSRAALDSTSGRVRGLLTDELIESVASASHVAGLLGVSVSTMNRRLALEGVSFGELLMAKRRQLAERLLAHSELPIAEIAARLGYGENATFTRSFHRWTGLPPRSYRQRQAPRGQRSRHATAHASPAATSATAD
ncbi:AraC family transcriptional regulator [Steroidobacter sp.]|uniref:AraC-like transcriptional regulator QhpR n=1 Tax=Steroidobacter sp. TaxID=1978227 RepID=UPI001A61FF12|nr:AraC family transcriptional regulator [Steroidobacter sp.]MBL8266671.1 AraC family transcriptional regulator [Steroidobacter sp.]